MKIGDNVLVNTALNILNPVWVAGEIISIFIAPKKNFYLVYLTNGEHVTVDEDYIQEA